MPCLDRGEINTRIVARVLSCHKSQRYAIERTLQSAWNDLVKERPNLSLEIVEVCEVADILKYTPVFAFASLMINEKLVCVGRIPQRDEVVEWLMAALEAISQTQDEASSNHE